MSNKFLKCVTVTGADNRTDRREMYDIAQEFPFVEWGILLTKSKGGTTRYPDEMWIDQLFSYPMNYAGHLCGSWGRDFANGGRAFAMERPRWITPLPILGTLFKRIQLNIAPTINNLKLDLLVNAVNNSFFDSRFIIQIKGHVPIWWPLDRLDQVDFLFDASGGRGIATDYWPHPITFVNDKRTLLSNCGYAGGLTPNNLTEQLKQMKDASEGQPIWIGVESGVRTDDVFDLEKVRKFLQIAEPYVIT